MWMVVGLGNPGSRYERNRHNVGFRVVDELARRHGLTFKGSKLGGETASGPLRGQRTVLLKPMEYMNLSGFAVQRAMGFHDVDLAHVIVVHDEIDLDLATLRLKVGGGHGGHNGLRSIIEQCGKPDFVRVRVGVGKPPGATAEKDVSSWVLGDFPANANVVELIARSADAVESILAGGIAAAMNDFNKRTSLTA